MKLYVIQSKNRIIMNIRVSVKNYVIGFLVKMIICGTLVYLIFIVRRHVKLTNIQILKINHMKMVYLVSQY